MDEVLPPLARLAGPHTLVVSIAAGRTIASFEQHSAGRCHRARMPNTPAAIGRGITVRPNAASRRSARCRRPAVRRGRSAWVDDEALLDPVTAVSGSGPAYLFLLAECLAEAGRAAGLDAELAEQLARATVAGAGALLEQSDLSAEQLRKNVTSPGGTTAAALEVLGGADGLQKR